MAKDLLIEVHTLTSKTDITKYCKSVSWSDGTSRPWSTIDANLKIPFGNLLRSEFAGVDADADLADDPPEPPETGTDDDPYRTKIRRGIALLSGHWLTVTDLFSGRLKAFGHILAKPDGQSGATGGRFASSPMTIRTESWIDFLGSLTLQIFNSRAESFGSLLGFDKFNELFALFAGFSGEQAITSSTPTQSSEQTSGLGFQVDKMERIFAILGDIRIPKTIIPGVTKLYELCNAVFDSDTASKFAPSRTTDRVPGVSSAGLYWREPNGTIVDLITSLFQPDPRMVEFFPSLEPIYQSVSAKQDGASVASTVIHRFKPWRKSPLSKVRQTSSGKSVVGTKLLEKVTWVLDKSTARISKNDIVRINKQQSDAERINIVTAAWPVAGISEPLWLEQSGLPIYDRGSIERHGARPFVLRWDFTTPDNGVDSDITDYLRALAYQAWQWYGHGHRFRSGTLETRYLGDRVRHGEPFIIDDLYPKEFVAYAERVTHGMELVNGAVASARTQIQFTRGLHDERAREVGTLEPVADPEPLQTPRKQKAQTKKVDPLCEVGLMQYLPSHIGPGELSAFARAGGTVYIPKVCDGGLEFMAQEYAALIYEARSLGLRLEGWGYHYCVSASGAVYEGKAAGRIANRLGLKKYVWDAETQWYNGNMVTITVPGGSPSRTAFGIAFVDAFRSVSGVELCCSGVPADESGVPNSLLAHFDTWTPQCYGFAPSTALDSPSLQATWVRSIDNGAGKPSEPVFTSGRAEGDHVWSPWTPQHGVLATINQLQLKRISIWYGAGSAGRISTNSVEPALKELIPLACQRKLFGES